MPGVPPLLSRALAIALLLAVAAGVWLGAVQPTLARWHEARSQIEQTRELLARYSRINAGREQLESEVEHWRQDVLPKSGAFSGGNPDGVAAELQSTVSNIVKAGGGDLLSIQILNQGEEGELRTVAVRVQFGADVEALMRMLHDIESTVPYLFIDNLQIRAGRMTARSRIRVTGAGRADAADTLFVTCDVFGYLRSAPT